MNIEELIAAGESVAQCRNLKTPLNTLVDQSVDEKEADTFEYGSKSTSSISVGHFDECPIRLSCGSANHKQNALRNCSRPMPNSSKCNNINYSCPTNDSYSKSISDVKNFPSKESEKILSLSSICLNSQSNAKPLKLRLSPASCEQNDSLINPKENNSSCSLQSDLILSNASKEQQSESWLQLLKNECASIFSLSLSMSSSLTYANRLLGQLIKSQSLASKYEESLLQEITSCEQNSLENELHLNKSAEKINILLAEIGNVYYKVSEYDNMFESIQQQSAAILKLTEELLIKNGMKHLVPDVDVERIGSLRLLEEVNLGLVLLSGEAPNQTLQIQNDHLNEMIILREQLEGKIKDLQTEFNEMNDNKGRKINNLQIQLEKMNGDLKELQCQLDFNEKEKESLEQSYKTQLRESENFNENLNCLLLKTQQESEKKLSDILCKDVGKHDINKDLETEISSLKNQIKLQDQQIMALEEDRKSFLESTRIAEKNYMSEKKKIQCHLKEATEDQISLKNRVKHLEEEVAEMEKAKPIEELFVQNLKDSILELKESHAEEINELQKKIDCKNNELCEKSSKIRSLEVYLMQANTELELEKQRVLTLSAEIDLLSKQIDKLRENMKKLNQFCPRELRLPGGLNNPSIINEQPKVSKLLEEGQKREEKLQLLLNQKNDQMKELQDSINLELINKNRELELLSESVETLESEMKEVTSSLNISSNMYDASQHTKKLLSVRAEHIENLQEKVTRLSLGGQSYSEEQALIIEDLQGKLSDSKKAVRAAREEARKERLEAAKLRQQLALLQIDLESAQEASRQTSYHSRSSLGIASSFQVEDGEFLQVNISGQSFTDFSKQNEN